MTPHFNGGEYDWDVVYTNRTTYNTYVSYWCGPARKLATPNGTLYNVKSIYCEWNQTWTPDNEVNESYRTVIQNPG